VSDTTATSSTSRYSPAQLADLEEIRALTHRYGLALDRFDVAGVLEVFTPDAVFDASPFGLAAMDGHESIREFFEHNEQSMANQMHLFANHIIEFDGPDEAHGTNYLFEDGFNKHGQRIHCLGLNEDHYVRTAEGWRIAGRKISPLVPPQLEGY
jgi:ketosteroid isomerase-like protein